MLRAVPTVKDEHVDIGIDTDTVSGGQAQQEEQDNMNRRGV
jgi:hypothetical protein